MTDFLLDTSTISFVLKGDRGVSRRLSQLNPDDRTYASVIVEGELVFGALRVGRQRRTELLDDIALFFSDLADVLPVSRDTALSWANLKREAEQRGRPVAVNDLWIAATAVQHDMTLVAHDADFESIRGLQLEDWVES